MPSSSAADAAGSAISTDARIAGATLAAPPPAPTTPPQPVALRLALPKGRMQSAVERLLADAGLELGGSERDYRPPLAGFDTKRLKPRAIVQMLASGTRDVGFCGLDWVRDEGADLVELCDTRLDPVRVTVAAPAAMAERLAAGAPLDRPLRLASEFERLPLEWAAARGIELDLVRSFGATEVLPPEDADAICDVVQTGSTLRANGLVEIEDVLASSTRLFANRRALDDPTKRERIDELALVVRGVLAARERVVVEVNVDADALDRVVALVPCMRRPTVASLAGDAGFAIKAAVPRTALARLVPALVAAGGRDVLVSRLEQIVP
ncbi:ATP phosphoribosyltransferase [Planctomycetes bacterium Pla163]|uniref:ATP phosphoribosyltransferase n=1 Tax=Rohdeia mirabilis TaxID=2528008 RepID=A0A518D2I5_9BACT|nr:ATP phosphoribosyltransferase [Planctomycetes bacterium Pla163]